MVTSMHDLLQDRGFRYHLIAYLVVNAILIVVNILHHHHIWFFWPLIGWGIGLAAHGYTVARQQKLPPRRPGPMGR
jgi:hypothetical protein